MDNPSTIDEWIKQWAEDYTRLFGQTMEDNDSEDEQTPLEMLRCVNDYEKWFVNEVDRKKQKDKLFKLKQIRACVQLHLISLDKVIAYIEYQLSQS